MEIIYSILLHIRFFQIKPQILKLYQGCNFVFCLNLNDLVVFLFYFDVWYLLQKKHSTLMFFYRYRFLCCCWFSFFSIWLCCLYVLFSIDQSYCLFLNNGSSSVTLKNIYNTFHLLTHFKVHTKDNKKHVQFCNICYVIKENLIWFVLFFSDLKSILHVRNV